MDEDGEEGSKAANDTSSDNKLPRRLWHTHARTQTGWPGTTKKGLQKQGSDRAFVGLTASTRLRKSSDSDESKRLHALFCTLDLVGVAECTSSEGCAQKKHGSPSITRHLNKEAATATAAAQCKDTRRPTPTRHSRGATLQCAAKNASEIPLSVRVRERD